MQALQTNGLQRKTVFVAKDHRNHQEAKAARLRGSNKTVQKCIPEQNWTFHSYNVEGVHLQVAAVMRGTDKVSIHVVPEVDIRNFISLPYALEHAA